MIWGVILKLYHGKEGIFITPGNFESLQKQTGELFRKALRDIDYFHHCFISGCARNNLSFGGNVLDDTFLTVVFVFF